MKKILIGALVLSVVVGLLLYLRSRSAFFAYRIGNKTYQLLTATTMPEWEKGLMFYKSKKELKGADGMIFLFPNKDWRAFWNENTYLDLDVYWLAGDKVLGKAYLPSITKTKQPMTIDSPGMADKVIEIVR